MKREKMMTRKEKIEFIKGIHEGKIPFHHIGHTRLRVLIDENGSIHFYVNGQIKTEDQFIKFRNQAISWSTRYGVILNKQVDGEKVIKMLPDGVLKCVTDPDSLFVLLDDDELEYFISLQDNQSDECSNEELPVVNSIHHKMVVGINLQELADYFSLNTQFLKL